MPIPTTRLTRESAIARAQMLGEQVNTFRLLLTEAPMPFIAGVVRAAEESLLVAITSLKEFEDKDL